MTNVTGGLKPGLTNTTVWLLIRALNKKCISFTRMPICTPNPMFGHLLESSHRDDSNKWSNIGFGDEITQVESIEVNFTDLIGCPVLKCRLT